MAKLSVMILLVAASLPAMAIECEFGGDGVTLAWNAVEGDYAALQIWYSPEEIVDAGIVVAELQPDETGAFASTVVLPPAFVVNPDECIGCGICVGQCPTDAIEMVDLKAVIDPEACIACGICAQNCPVDAIYAPAEGDHFAVVGIDAEGEAVVLESL